MEQLVFDLATPEPPSFRNFVTGRNGELVAVLEAISRGDGRESGLLVWGPEACGKTHLLRATVRATEARGAAAAWLATPGALTATDPEVLARNAVVAVDAVDTAPPDAQARLFTLYNGLKANGGRLLAASRSPPAALPLRGDLRTRLVWGLVYELLPLSDADKPAALEAYARQRGFTLSPGVVEYLLAHARRDMTALIGVLEALDRHSLATKRPITVAMLREWLQRPSLPGRRPEEGGIGRG